jgi:hypothetical protein
MLLSDFLKNHGIEIDATTEEPPALSDGVRFLLFLLSRRHIRGASVSIDQATLENEWPPSLTELFDQSLHQAAAAGYVQGVPAGYSLTDLGKSAAR